jgi:23S rRNA pseudouridine1911/1915/1917 synthase
MKSVPRTDVPVILFEDPHLIVLSKPAGLLSQGEHTGDVNLVDWLREHFGRNYVGIIHRLDRNTSGAMVVAKRTKSAQRLTSSLQKGEIARSYLAWIEGSLTAPAKWKHFLTKDEKQNRSRAVKANHPEAKEAILTVKPVTTSALAGPSRGEILTLAEFVLETGRSHQIRVQAATEKHPLVGDAKYGGIETPLIDRPALHSYHIEFPHPMTGVKMAFNAPIPEDFKGISKSNLSNIDHLLMQAGSEMFGEARSPE